MGGPIWTRLPDSRLRPPHVADLLERDEVLGVYLERGQLFEGEFDGLAVETDTGGVPAIHLLVHQGDGWVRDDRLAGEDMAVVRRADGLVHVETPTDLLEHVEADEPDLDEHVLVGDDDPALVRWEQAVRWVVGRRVGLDPDGLVPTEVSWEQLQFGAEVGVMYQHTNWEAVEVDARLEDGLRRVARDADWTALCERVADTVSHQVHALKPGADASPREGTQDRLGPAFTTAASLPDADRR